MGEQLPRSAAQSLQTLIARLRKALSDAATCLVTSPTGYMLVVDDDAIDARVFAARYHVARDWHLAPAIRRRRADSTRTSPETPA